MKNFSIYRILILFQKQQQFKLVIGNAKKMLGDYSIESDTMDCQAQTPENHHDNLIIPKCIQGEDTLLSYLKKYYPQSQHISVVINGCYRNHHTRTIKLFNQIRLSQFIQIQQPKISNFFENDCFINLEQLGKHKSQDQQIKQYIGPYIQPIPKDLNKILDDLYRQHGYIPNFQRLLLFFPTYLSKHIKLFYQLFQNHHMYHPMIYFLGVAAAAELGCLYFMTRFIKKFQRSGGSMDWLINKTYPKKIEVLLQLNRKLARSFWQVDTEYIEKIVIQGEINHRQLAYICMVLTYVHQMSTISLSMALREEENYDILGMKTIRAIVQSQQMLNYPPHHKENSCKTIHNLPTEEETVQRNSGKNRKTLKRQQHRLESETQIEGYMKQIAKDLNQQQIYTQIHNNLNPLLPLFKPIDRRQQNLYPRIDYSEYNFQFNAYPVLKSLINQTADSLFELLQYSQDMTLNSIGSQKNLINIGTKPFRKTLTYYSKNLCGFTHLDYDYKNNYKKYLTMPLKFQLRLMTFSPVHISKQVITEINQEKGQMECFENAHAAILIASTKMSMALMMVLRAWSQHQEE